MADASSSSGSGNKADESRQDLEKHMKDVVRRAGMTSVQAAILSGELRASFESQSMDRIEALVQALDAVRTRRNHA